MLVGTVACRRVAHIGQFNHVTRLRAALYWFAVFLQREMVPTSSKFARFPIDRAQMHVLPLCGCTGPCWCHRDQRDVVLPSFSVAPPFRRSLRCAAVVSLRSLAAARCSCAQRALSSLLSSSTEAAPAACCSPLLRSLSSSGWPCVWDPCRPHCATPAGRSALSALSSSSAPPASPHPSCQCCSSRPASACSQQAVAPCVAARSSRPSSSALCSRLWQLQHSPACLLLTPSTAASAARHPAWSGAADSVTADAGLPLVQPRVGFIPPPPAHPLSLFLLALVLASSCSPSAAITMASSVQPVALQCPKCNGQTQRDLHQRQTAAQQLAAAPLTATDRGHADICARHAVCAAGTVYDTTVTAAAAAQQLLQLGSFHAFTSLSESFWATEVAPPLSRAGVPISTIGELSAIRLDWARASQAAAAAPPGQMGRSRVSCCFCAPCSAGSLCVVSASLCAFVPVSSAGGRRQADSSHGSTALPCC